MPRQMCDDAVLVSSKFPKRCEEAAYWYSHFCSRFGFVCVLLTAPPIQVGSLQRVFVDAQEDGFVCLQDLGTCYQMRIATGA